MNPVGFVLCWQVDRPLVALILSWQQRAKFNYEIESNGRLWIANCVPREPTGESWMRQPVARVQLMDLPSYRSLKLETSIDLDSSE